MLIILVTSFILICNWNVCDLKCTKSFLKFKVSYIEVAMFLITVNFLLWSSSIQVFLKRFFQVFEAVFSKRSLIWFCTDRNALCPWQYLKYDLIINWFDYQPNWCSVENVRSDKILLVLDSSIYFYIIITALHCKNQNYSFNVDITIKLQF